jgi:hypothetical protein
MDNKKIERATVDGRRAETHVQERVSDGATNRITTHYEEMVPLEMKKRVAEKIVPIVLERVTEQFDGENVVKTIEKVADDYTRLTGLTPVQQSCVTKEDVEEAVQKALEKTKGISFKLPIPRLSTPDVPVTNGSVIVSYALITLLAIALGVLVWQLFFR